MIEQHQIVFSQVATKCHCWIGVRYPNILADKWIMTPGCVAKPLWCKAKTADSESHPLAGLVVSPLICEDAFELESMPKALRLWRDVLTMGKLMPGFSVDEDGKDKGVLRIGGHRVHTDYDLMSVLDADERGGKKFTSKKRSCHLFSKIQIKLNVGFKKKMIMHNSEMVFQGMGAADNESVMWFGPDNAFECTNSTLAKQYSDFHKQAPTHSRVLH